MTFAPELAARIVQAQHIAVGELQALTKSLVSDWMPILKSQGHEST